MRILQISTHTTLNPTHGGQIRSNRIAGNLEKNGHVVHRLAVGYRPHDHIDDEREPHIDIAKSSYCRSRMHIRDFGSSWGYFTDYGTMVAARESPEITKLIFDQISLAAPDLIMLEHPWLWPILDLYFKAIDRKIPFLYNSQNVEALLKRDIAINEGLNVDGGIFSSIENLERECVLNAYATTTCSESDQKVFIELGGDFVVNAPNGTDPALRDHLLNVLPQTIPENASYALVIGSGHPPNISGFMNLMSAVIPNLTCNQRFVIAGGAGDYIFSELEKQGKKEMLRDRCINLGFVSKPVLDAVISNANVIALPIQYGGGSNLKTAEALLSGRRVVGTHHSLRGFPDADCSPNLRIACDDTFGITVLEELSKPFRINYDGSATHLLWENTTRSIVEVVGTLQQRQQEHSYTPTSM